LAWSLEFTATALRQLRTIDRTWQLRILDCLEKDIAGLDDPRSRGKALVGDGRGLWRYRVGDYRILCDLDDGRMVICAVLIGHRRDSCRG